MREVSLKQARNILRKQGIMIAGHKQNGRYITATLVTPEQRKIRRALKTKYGMPISELLNMYLESLD